MAEIGQTVSERREPAVVTRSEAGLLIYDLDGTLVDSVPDIAVALNVSLAASGLPPVDEGTVRGWIGNGARKLVERALRHNGKPADAVSIDRLYRQFLQDYADKLCERTRIYPGARECLEACHERGWSQAVVTNKPAALAVGLLEALGLDRYFSSILGGDSLPEKKPDPAPLVKVMHEQGVAREMTLMIGDSDADLDAARAAGVDSVAVTYGYNCPNVGSNVDLGVGLSADAYFLDRGAKAVFDTLSELPAWLERREAC